MYHTVRPRRYAPRSRWEPFSALDVATVEATLHDDLFLLRRLFRPLHDDTPVMAAEVIGRVRVDVHKVLPSVDSQPFSPDVTRSLEDVSLLHAVPLLGAETNPL